MKDLKKFRNEIIAHRWRENGKLTLPQRTVYDVPRSFFEYQFLKHLIRYSYQIIKAEFEVELTEALHSAEIMKEATKSKLNLSTVNEDMKKLQEELNVVCLKLGKDYDLQLFTYT